jgi:hypothetical protein
MLANLFKQLVTSRRPPDSGDILQKARQLNLAACHEEALSLLTPLQLREPGNAPCLYEMARAHAALGDRQRALALCRQSREADLKYAAPRWLEAELTLGGENYMRLLGRIHEQLRPRTYVEIGIFQGEALALAAATTKAIGIDPEPRLAAPLAANQKVFALASDVFFKSHDLRAEFDSLPVDLAFIDGMHHFEFALRDFAHLERHCTRNSVILIHDCYPLDRHTARRDGAPPFWAGDVWRLIVLLKKYRPDLSVSTLAAPPTGLALVKNLDPESGYLIDHHDRLREEFLALDYAYLDDDKAGKLNLVGGDWQTVRDLLPAR